MDDNSFYIVSSLMGMFPTAQVEVWEDSFVIRDGKFTRILDNTNLYYKPATSFENIVNHFKYLAYPQIVDLCNTEDHKITLSTCPLQLASIWIDQVQIADPFYLLYSHTPEQLNERIVESLVMEM